MSTEQRIIADEQKHLQEGILHITTNADRREKFAANLQQLVNALFVQHTFAAVPAQHQIQQEPQFIQIFLCLHGIVIVCVICLN